MVAQYIKVSGDTNVLNEELPFLEGMKLEPEQDDAYFEPTQSLQKNTLFEHCARALDISMEIGSHGLPLMGSGDWNDGMNRVGNQGKGESVWMAWFLISTISEFAAVAEANGDNERVIRWREFATKLKLAAETEAWDGAWYRRAFFDDGTPLGSATNTECRIDSIAQSWGVISGAAETERAKRAMDSVTGISCSPRRRSGLVIHSAFQQDLSETRGISRVILQEFVRMADSTPTRRSGLLSLMPCLAKAIKLLNCYTC